MPRPTVAWMRLLERGLPHFLFDASKCRVEGFSLRRFHAYLRCHESKGIADQFGTLWLQYQWFSLQSSRKLRPRASGGRGRAPGTLFRRAFSRIRRNHVKRVAGEARNWGAGMILLIEAALPALGHVAVVTSTCITPNARLGAGFGAKLGVASGR